MPLYRQEAYFDMLGVSLSGKTLCNWTLSASSVLQPVYDQMKSELLKRNYIHADETVLKELREVYSNNKDYYDIRFKERQTKLAPILDNFISYINEDIKNALPRSALGKALDYAQKYVPSLKNVLLDGSLEVDNNGAEREIKPFVIGRKNFLFCKTAKGTTASSYLYSIIETAKANNLVVEKYFIYIFENLI